METARLIEREWTGSMHIYIMKTRSCTLGHLVGLKQGRETEKKNVKQRERVSKSKEKKKRHFF